MRRRVARGAAAALALVALSAPAQAGALTVSDRDSLEQTLVSRINAIRKNHGLRMLTVRTRLDAAADAHVSSMAVESYFRHELYTPARPTNWTPFGTWIRRFWPGPGYAWWTAGENLAWGAPRITASQTVSRWMASPPHRANILNPGWRNIGVSAVHVSRPRGYFSAWDDVTIVAAEFGSRR
jgi:uncharacterized protein YkwD